MDQDQHLYSVAEVADIVGVTRQTVRSWIAKGELAAINLRGNQGFRIAREALDRFLASRQTTQAA